MYNKIIKVLNSNAIPHYTAFKINKRFMIFFYPRFDSQIELITNKCEELKLSVRVSLEGVSYDISSKG